MKISPAKAGSFIAAPPATLAAILVYGPDRGLSDTRLIELAKVFADDLDDPFQVSHLDGATLRGTPGRFWDEVTAQSLTGGRRVVLLRGAGDGQAEDFKRYLAENNGPQSAMLLLQAGELGPRAKLRKYAEAADNAAALVCYPLEGAELGQFIQAELAIENIAIEKPALDYLCHALGENHGLRKSELAKLSLYVGKNGHLTLQDVENCIVATAETGLGELALAVGAGNLGQLERLAERAWRDNASPISVLRSVLSHFQRLYRVATSIAAGTSQDRAMAGLRPPVFWKAKQQFSAQLRIWTVANLQEVLDHLVEAECLLKTTGIPARAACHRELLAISQRARRRG